MNNETAIGGAGETVDAAVDANREPFECLAEEFVARLRRGETPSITEYLDRYPEHRETIRKLLPAVAMVERLGRGLSPATDVASLRSMPAQLGDFRIVRELGRGGMGVVYEAVQESLGRSVALKVMHHAAIHGRQLERFSREAQAVARLHHTNIVPIFAVGEHEGVPYYAMQYIRGRGLDSLLDEWRSNRKSLDGARWQFVARVGIQAGEALEYAHQQGILHRDVKPANLLVDEHESLWITDFGLAKLAGQNDLTKSGDVIGTLRYLAPEALAGRTGPQSDVYSLGLTLYELVTLNTPFGDVSASELLRQVSESQPTRPRKLDPSIPRDLETIVLKAIAPEPAARYATALALAEDLRRFFEDRPIRARRVTAIERLTRWSRRNRAVAALAATAAAALVLAAIVGWAGFASARRALARSDQNVKLSLDVFGALFDKLSPDESFFPPPTGRRGKRLPPQHGPERPMLRGDHGPGPGGPMFPLPPSANPFEVDRPIAREGMGVNRAADALAQTALLQSVLDFYERFGRTNEMNSRLQGEAARAYFRVGLLLERLDRPADAEQALERAVTMYDELAARFPDVKEYRSKIVEIAIMTDPWSLDPNSLPALESRLLRAQAIVNELASAWPDELDHIQSQIHVDAKLGAVLQRRGHPGEAEAAYRRAIGYAGTLMERARNPARATIDRADIREAMALLVLESGRRDEASGLLEGAVADLQSLPDARPLGPMLGERFTSLAEGFRKLGDPARAATVQRLARPGDGQPRRIPR